MKSTAGPEICYDGVIITDQGVRQVGFGATVAAIFRSRAAGASLPEPPVPTGYQVDISVPDDDPAPNLPPRGGDSIDGIGCVFGTLYADSMGRVTWRRITVRGLIRDGHDVIVRAYCHERHAPRHFRSSGIRELVNLMTGEVIDSASDYFERFLSEDPTYRAIRRCDAALQILTFMARCDGHEAPSERGLILEYIRECCPESKLDEGALCRHLGTLHPDEETFLGGLDALEGMSTEDAVRIVEYAIRIVEADGLTDPREARWLEDIKAALR